MSGRGRRHGRGAPRSGRPTAAVQFWPRTELEPARALWPDLVAVDDGDYWTLVERNLRNAPSGVNVLLVPMRVRELAEHCARSGADAGAEAAREAYAEERVAVGDVVPWPPRPDDPCWCASGVAYEFCCLRV